MRQRNIRMMDDSHMVPRLSLQSSFTCARPPNSRRAVRRASASLIPWCRSCRLPAILEVKTKLAVELLLHAAALQRRRTRSRRLCGVAETFRQLRSGESSSPSRPSGAALRTQSIELCFATRFCRAPFGDEKLFVFEAMKGWVERALPEPAALLSIPVEYCMIMA